MSQNSIPPLHFVEHGEGVPVLALHGWSPDHRLMTGFLEPLFAARPGWRRIYPDLPGMGRTPATGAVASSRDILAAVSRFADERIGDRPFLLVGESYGGYLARALANVRPDRVRGLALVCPIGTQVRHAARTLPERSVIAPDPDLMAGLDEAEAEAFGSLAVVQSPETLRRFRESIAPGLRVADFPALERIQRDWELDEAPESGAPYAHPAVILTGRQDNATGYADAYALLDHYPRATFAVLDRAGHNAQIEQPALVAALLGEWLDRVEESGGLR
ncbi:alpha/beta fold hydrolase [Glycomyces sp. NRRL B-16210]|uniref:alpha/beta fold hydrolase n=1 Tax=Glycomyces sp. NRRL B-16210 TaxID=1463821 RepID=UPI000B2F0057|nr:alpha/beta hydrolase [Glycomyces sp. NRRL B-16210]